ncbi:MAG: FAD:protein FMN transferase [Luteimonas sp.]
MGTRWRVCAVLPRATRALPTLHDAIQQRLDGVVAQMSTWEADSDISGFNRAAAGSWQRLPQACFAVLRCALDIAADSDGAYDPTVAPLVALWGFGAHAGAQRVPDAAALAAARARVGWQRLQLRAHETSALQPGGMALDLSAIAKGHGVDAVVDCLRARDVTAALVDVGGEVFGAGCKPDGTPWRVAIEDSADDALPGQAHDACVLRLDGIAAATSGDCWHHFEHGGRRYAHTIDPRTGAPVMHAPVAVTVLAGTAMAADAWSTALTAMGAEAGLVFAGVRGMAARFVVRGVDGIVVTATPAFDECVAR